MSKAAQMSHYGACLARVVGGELAEICQRRRVVTPVQPHLALRRRIIPNPGWR